MDEKISESMQKLAGEQNLFLLELSSPKQSFCLDLIKLLLLRRHTQLILHNASHNATPVLSIMCQIRKSFQCLCFF